MKAYASHVFDLDGTLIASNAAKCEAFYRAGLPYGEQAAKSLVAFHQQAGSITRRARFEHFFSAIIKREPIDGEIDDAMAVCARWVLGGTLAVPLVRGVVPYLESLEGQCLVVSGIEQSELEYILNARGLAKHFARAWGGPKAELLGALVDAGTIQQPAVYYGDEYADLVAAKSAGLDFVYVAGASQWAEGRLYCSEREVPTIDDFVPVKVEAA